MQRQGKRERESRKKPQGPKAPDQDSEEKCHLVIRDRLFCYALWRLTPSAGENHYHKNDNDEGRFGCSPPRLCSARSNEVTNEEMAAVHF